MRTLEEISEKYGTGENLLGGDKCVRHNYCKKYDFHFEQLRDKKFNLLEIGIMEGRSLKSWKDYFPNSKIVGIDIDKNCKHYEEDRIFIEIGDQKNKNFLLDVNNKHGPFDVVIDDGSHIWEDIILSFEVLFPVLNPSGFYVIEDLHTSYKSNFSGNSKISAINYLKNIVDKINLFGKYKSHASGLQFASLKQERVATYNLNKKDCSYDAYSIHFYPSICFIQKENVFLHKKVLI